MEKKTIRSGAPFVFAGAGVMAVALTMGIGSLVSYPVALAVGAAGYALGRKKYPDRVIEVETAPKSGNAEVDALIREARGQLDQIAAANDAIADPALSRQIEDIEATCRLILQRLEEQPNMLSQLRTFLRYYLPATLKLLNARAALEAEVSAGQSADIAARIAKAVEQVQSAFHKQLDALNEFRFINLESEMDVLADMLKSDGLTAEPDFCGGHDWTRFYIAPYGWLYADPSYGTAAVRAQNEERRKFYFGNIDAYRMVANSEFEAPFTVEKQFWRADPYDNQVGEIETSDRGLRYEEYTRSKEVLSCEELDPRA